MQLPQRKYVRLLHCGEKWIEILQTETVTFYRKLISLGLLNNAIDYHLPSLRVHGTRENRMDSAESICCYSTVTYTLPSCGTQPTGVSPSSTSRFNNLAANRVSQWRQLPNWQCQQVMISSNLTLAHLTTNLMSSVHAGSGRHTHKLLPQTWVVGSHGYDLSIS